MNRRYESRIRRLAARNGYRVVKSRRRESVNNCGEFMLVEAESNAVVLGCRFDASVEEIESFFGEEEATSAVSTTEESNGQRRAG